jgi:alpha-tubulin suppressor-like RCC1 family protein
MALNTKCLKIKRALWGGVGCLTFLMLAAVAVGLTQLSGDSLAWQATSITPNSGSVDGNDETFITGDFDLAAVKIVKVQVMSGQAVAALDDQGQVYTWGESIEVVGYGRQNAGGICYYYINWINYFADMDYTNAADCLAAGADYAWEEIEEFYTPRNINQLAGGDIGPDTVIIDIFATENNFFALDDQGEVYVWGEGTDAAGVDWLEACDYTNYDDQTDCENADGYWSEEIYAPTSINRVAAGDIGPSTRIEKLYISGESEWVTIYAIDDQGQLYGWGSGNFGNGAGGEWYSAPININQAAAGDIGPSTAIVDVATDGETTYAVDDQGQVYVWGSYESNGLGVIYVCTDGQYLTESDCVAGGEWWYKDVLLVDVDVPINLSLAAAGAITPAVKIVDVELGGGGGFAIDDQGQLYAWSGRDDDFDYITGLGVSWFCSDYPYYTTQADCENADHYWEQGFTPTYNTPVNVNLVAAGSIQPDTVVKSITTVDGNMFVLDADGQLHVWGNYYDVLALGEDYYYEYCSWGEGDDQVTCENNGGHWTESDQIPAPVSVNAVAAGDIGPTTRIVGLYVVIDEGYPLQYFAVDDEGQLYVWGYNEDGSAGLGNDCSNPDSNGSQYWCELEGGTWDATKNVYELYAPVNINQIGDSVIGDDVAVAAVYGGGGEGYNMFAIDTDGGIHAWGSYKEIFGVSPCSIESIFDSETRCVNSGGVWDESKDLIEQDYSALTIDQFTSGGSGGANGGYEVFFDGVISPEVTIIDAHTLRVITPPHVAGAVDVTVSYQGVTSALYGGYEYIGSNVSVPPPGQPFAPPSGGAVVPGAPNTGRL